MSNPPTLGQIYDNIDPNDLSYAAVLSAVSIPFAMKQGSLASCAVCIHCCVHVKAHLSLATGYKLPAFWFGAFAGVFAGVSVAFLQSSCLCFPCNCTSGSASNLVLSFVIGVSRAILFILFFLVRLREAKK